MFQVKFIENTYGVLLCASLLIFPFAFSGIPDRWLFFLVCTLGVQFYLMLNLERKNYDLNKLGIIFSILFIMIFGYAEKVNFSQQFNFSIDSRIRIPLSTIFLALAMLAFLVKVVMEKKVRIKKLPYVYFIFIAFFFLLVLQVAFYPIVKSKYPVTLAPGVHLLNNILKYSMLIFLTTNFLSEKIRLRRFNAVLMSSIAMTIILGLIL